jgi:hypothetical protein
MFSLLHFTKIRQEPNIGIMEQWEKQNMKDWNNIIRVLLFSQYSIIPVFRCGGEGEEYD